MPRILTPMEAANIMGVGRNKIYELLRQKRLPYTKIGTEYKIPEDLLLAHIQNAALNCQELPVYTSQSQRQI